MTSQQPDPFGTQSVDPPRSNPAKIPALAWTAACLIALVGLCAALLLALAGGAALIPDRAVQTGEPVHTPTARIEAFRPPPATGTEPPPDPTDLPDLTDPPDPTDPPATAPGLLLNSVPTPFQDDFSDPSSGWLTRTGTGWEAGYDRGGFRIAVDHPDRIAWATPGLHYDDVSLEVSATKIAGADENFFGILCRYQDEDNFYIFAISSDGYYVIGKYQGGEFSPLGDQAMGYSVMIHQGRTTNRIRAGCTGDTLALYVNDTRLAQVEDSSFASGDVGLAAAAFEIGNTNILFDDFVSTRP